MCTGEGGASTEVRTKASADVCWPRSIPQQGSRDRCVSCFLLGATVSFKTATMAFHLVLLCSSAVFCSCQGGLVWWCLKDSLGVWKQHDSPCWCISFRFLGCCVTRWSDPEITLQFVCRWLADLYCSLPSVLQAGWAPDRTVQYTVAPSSCSAQPVNQGYSMM